MNQRTFRRGAALGVAAACVAGGAALAAPISTNAYEGLQASASATPNGDGKGSTVVVNYSGANPGCDIKFDVNENDDKVILKGHIGSGSVTLQIRSKKGTHKITVKTINCDSSDQKDKTKATFTIGPATTGGAKIVLDDDETEIGDKVEFDLGGFPSKAEVSYSAVGPGGQTLPVKTARVSKKGVKEISIRFPVDGDWTVSAASSGVAPVFATVKIYKEGEDDD